VWTLAKLSWFHRAASALGGLLIFVGILVIGVFALALFGIIDFEVFTEAGYRPLLVWALFTVSILDLAAGLVLLRR